MAAIILPVLMAASGAAIDFARWNNERSQFKELADTLATRGAREFLLANTTESQIKAVINSTLESGLPAHFGISGTITPTIVVDEINGSVSVSLAKAPAKALILTKFEPYKSGMNLTSVAHARGGMNVCVVALDENKDGAVSVGLSATLSAPDCSIMSNSTTANGVVAWGQAKVEAGLICSAGGYGGYDTNFDPTPTTDCPPYVDPLATRAPPNITSPVFYDTQLGEQSPDVFMAALTDSVMEASAARMTTMQADSSTSEVDTTTRDTSLTHETYELDPGVYVGGISIASNADVILNPGIYVIKDGPFAVDMGARITGEGVGFYLVGDDATFTFGPDSKIDLSAPVDGPMAGILFFEDRGAPVGRTHRILSNDARNLLGTFYLPRGYLRVSTMQPIADESDYTIIVARGLQLSGSPTLVLNTRYASSSVPVPAGIGPVGGTVALRQ